MLHLKNPKTTNHKFHTFLITFCINKCTKLYTAFKPLHQHRDKRNLSSCCVMMCKTDTFQTENWQKTPLTCLNVLVINGSTPPSQSESTWAHCEGNVHCHFTFPLLDSFEGFRVHLQCDLSSLYKKKTWHSLKTD